MAIASPGQVWGPAIDSFVDAGAREHYRMEERHGETVRVDSTCEYPLIAMLTVMSWNSACDAPLCYLRASKGLGNSRRPISAVAGELM